MNAMWHLLACLHPNSYSAWRFEPQKWLPRLAIDFHGGSQSLFHHSTVLQNCSEGRRESLDFKAQQSTCSENIWDSESWSEIFLNWKKKKSLTATQIYSCFTSNGAGLHPNTCFASQIFFWCYIWDAQHLFVYLYSHLHLITLKKKISLHSPED